MNDAFFSVFVALAGSVVGALAGVTTIWLTLNAQERGRRSAQAMARRENLYGEFIDEASKIVTDALTHKLDDASKFAPPYALVSKLGLVAPATVVSKGGRDHAADLRDL